MLSGRLPPVLADIERRSEARGYSPTDIWRGFTIGNDQGGMPDHVLVVRTAEFVPPDALTLVGAIEGPRPGR